MPSHDRAPGPALTALEHHAAIALLTQWVTNQARFPKHWATLREDRVPRLLPDLTPEGCARVVEKLLAETLLVRCLPSGQDEPARIAMNPAARRFARLPTVAR